MLTLAALGVLVLALWVGGGMLVHPDAYLQAKRERAPVFRGLAERLNQPTAINLWATRLTGAVIVAVGMFAAVILVSH